MTSELDNPDIKGLIEEITNQITVRKHIMNRLPSETLNKFFDVKPIPAEWENARRQISSRAGCHAIIAGGAIRDHLLRYPVKDIDIFILGMAPQAAKETFGAEIVEYTAVVEAKHHYELVNGLTVDLVFSHFITIDTVLNDFDLGICRVAWDGWDFVVTDDFLRDVENRTITVFDESYADHRGRVLAKLKPYGFNLARPPKSLEAWEDEVRALAHRRGYRLMHRRNGQYWLMEHQPMRLEEVYERLHQSW